MSRKTVLIFCSHEALPTAKAVHENLLRESLDAELWTHGTFNSSLTSRLDQLLAAVQRAAFGVVLLTPDDRAVSRGRESNTPRDNCIFELALLIGALGKESVHWIRPAGTEIRIPSNLHGLDAHTYNDGHNLVASTAPACDKIARAIRDRPTPSTPSSADTFESFFPWLRERLLVSTTLSCLFIHSRRFFDSFTVELEVLLAKDTGSISIYLPDVRHTPLMHALASRFDDGAIVPGLIKQSYALLHRMKQVHGERVRIFGYNLVPPFSLYVFDSHLLLASYPITAKKAPVPATVVSNESSFGKAALSLFADLCLQCKHESGEYGYDLETLAKEFLV